ncbi:MAG: hypothetical protein QF895_03995, partial [SAR86 cluster bacterium]|nr:hypothetical protein [SAR86 cluster bacterium]
TGTLNYSGSLVGIQTGDETSTQVMLDNGVTLDSTTIIQNCEWSGSSSSCGQAQSGRDTFKTTVKILDSDNNVLSQVDQIRNTDAGYYANAHKYTDQVIYNSAGSNKFDWTWTGIDGDSTPVDLGGPNLLGAKLTMTYDNTVIEESTSTALTNLQEELAEFEEEVIEFIMEEEIEITMEVEEVQETFSFTPMLMVFEEEEIMEEEIMEEEIVMEEESIIEETPMTASFFSAITQEEEIYEETEEITASFLPMVSQEEEMVQEEEEIIEESPVMESAQEEVIEEEETVAKGPVKMVQNTHEEKKEKTVEEKKEVKEEKKEKVKKESTVAKKEEKEETAEEESNSESATEVTSANNSEQEKIQQKKALVKNIDRVMDKVDSDVKDISKNLQIKNIIKLEAMTSEQASLDMYANAVFYKPKDIYLEQLNIFDNRQIYNNVSLASYIKNDKVAIKANALYNINLKKQRLLKELEILKNGKI